jgi:putative lipoic acid-binding regulatory protein
MSEETLLVFPCVFPVKAMGRVDVQIESIVIEIIQRHSPDTLEQAFTSRLSKDGNYISITAQVSAVSKQQLDAIYQELSTHPLVLFAL